MKKILPVVLFFLFACGNSSNSIYIPIKSREPKPVCSVCIGWVETANGGQGTWLWTSSEDPLPVCDISTCDTNKFDCASYTSYSMWPLYDQAQCQ